MPWTPLQGGLAYAICVYPFRATEPHDLPLEIGDQIYVIEQGGSDGEWYRGYLLSPPSLLAALTSDGGQQLEHRVFTGIFPRNCVEVRELVGEGRTNGQIDTQSQSGTRLDSAHEDEGANDGDSQRRARSQVRYSRRASRALVKKSSSPDLARKGRLRLVSAAEAKWRDANAPKPLAPVPLLRVGDEAGESAEEPLVDEIASCLREWHDARLHELLLARNYARLAEIRELVKRVDTSRKQLLHDVLTTRELSRLREDTVWDLVAGNKLLNDDVIVRSPTEHGRILTADDSVIEMTRLQANMNILDRPPKPQPELHILHHILVDVKNLVCEEQSPAFLHMYLCSKAFGEKPKALSENYAISLPLAETPSEKAIELPKTLFAELSAADVGAGGGGSQIFVVFKLIRDEPLRDTDRAPAYQPPDRQSFLGPRNSSSGIRERRSILGTQKKRESHSRQTSDATIRPISSRSGRPESEGHNNSAATETPASSSTKTARRTAGFGAVELTRLARDQSELATAVTLWTPCAASEDQSDGSADWSEIIHELATHNETGFTRAGKVTRLEIFAASFISADLDVLVRNNPSLLHGVHQTQKLGFSGVPTKPRSDIYLTLSGPVIGDNPYIQHPRFGNIPLQQRCQSGMANLQLTLEVRKADGARVESCVFTAANNQGHTAWRTTAIERGEEWSQTIKLAIPPEDVPGTHVVMSLADSPNFPFALGWVPLWESGAFVHDGEHQVALYVYDEYTSSTIAGRGAYLNLPPWHKKENEPSYGSFASLTVRTYLCSTKYSQDPNLLGLLSWRQYHGDELVQLLDRFAFVPGIEMVKLLNEVYGALFEILNEYPDVEVYEDAVFYALVTIMATARDKRFNLNNTVEQYATSVHKWPSVSRSLMRAFYRLVTNPLDPAASRKLRAALKIGDQMLKLIVEARNPPEDNLSLSSNGTSGGRYEKFNEDLGSLFVAVMALLRNPMAVLLGTQTLIVQHFHTWLPQLVSVMRPTEIMDVATNLLDACAQAQGKMILYRLILIVNFNHLDMFKDPSVRAVLIANTFRWLAPYWGHTAEVDDQWYNQVRLCCSVVAAQIEELGDETCQYVPKLVESYVALEKAHRGPKRTFSLLFPTTIPFPTRSTSSDIEIDEAMLEISALLAAALTSQQRLYFDQNQFNASGVLLQCLRVYQSILTGGAFPKNWLSLHISHHRHAVSALERIADVLIDCLPDSTATDVAEVIDFDTQSWKTFFDTLLAAVSSPSLAMETFPEQKRRAVWKIAGDVREQGANLIRRSWEALGWEVEPDSKSLHGFDRMGGYQVEFVPGLVAPIVELCLSVHASLRSVAIEVLRSMIISTWEIDEDLGIIQSAIIDCLDRICRSRKLAEPMLQKTFIDEIVAQFKPLQNTVEDSMYNAVVAMFAKIEELLGMLATVHSGESANEAHMIMDTLKLMTFFKDVQSGTAYIRYVHQLSALQLAAGYQAEAGLALKLHADCYDWDPAKNAPAITDPPFPAQTAFERKEALYFELCKHLEAGQSWAPALDAYKELAYHYEETTFDFHKLARCQRAMAGIHEKIARGDRSNPRYFRVVFRGLGFPPSLREKTFIYEGLPTDRLATFEERLQQMYPTAQILRANQEPAVEGQFLNVFPVSAHKDVAHVVYQRNKVSLAVRDYSLFARPQKFTTSTRHLQTEVPVADQVVEKIVYTTAEPFPNILRRSEVVDVQNITLSPMQAAVERSTRKTQELLVLHKRISSGQDKSAITRMTEELLLSVDANSDSSVSRYRALLPASEQPDVVSQEIDFDEIESGHEVALDSMQNALKVALLDHVLAIRRCLALYNNPEYKSTRAELVPRFEATFAHELSTLLPGNNGMIDERSPRNSSIEQPPPSTAQELETQADNGAQQTDSADQRDGRPRSRRRSIPFLPRSFSAQRQARETPSASVDSRGRSTRQISHTARDSSTQRRLSWLKPETSGGSDDITPLANGSMKEASLHSARTPPTRGSLRKRLSNLKGGSH